MEDGLGNQLASCAEALLKELSVYDLTLGELKVSLLEDHSTSTIEGFLFGYFVAQGWWSVHLGEMCDLTDKFREKINQV